MPGNADRILTAQEQKFIRMYVKPEVRDLRRAAELIGLKGTMGKTMYKRLAVKAEIDRRLGLVTTVQAIQDAADAKLLEQAAIEEDLLANKVLDQALLDMVKLDAKEHGSTKLQAIRMALVVKGRVQTRDMTAVAQQGATQTDNRPSIYGSINPQLQQSPVATTTMRRTEEVIQTHPPAQPTKQHVFEVIEH